MGTIMYALFYTAIFASWLNHIVVCLVDDKYGFLIAGALFVPVGIIHGFGNFLGVW